MTGILILAAVVLGMGALMFLIFRDPPKPDPTRNINEGPGSD